MLNRPSSAGDKLSDNRKIWDNRVNVFARCVRRHNGGLVVVFLMPYFLTPNWYREQLGITQTLRKILNPQTADKKVNLKMTGSISKCQVAGGGFIWRKKLSYFRYYFLPKFMSIWKGYLILYNIMISLLKRRFIILCLENDVGRFFYITSCNLHVIYM